MSIVFRILGLGVAATAAVTMLSVGCDQPPVRCSLGHGVFGVKMNLISIEGDESQGCGKFKAEIFGGSSYNDMRPPGDALEGYPDFNKASLAIQALSVGNMRDTGEAADIVDGDPKHVAYSFGYFTTAEPVGDFCEVPTLEPAQLNLALIPAVEDDPETEDENEAVPAIPAMNQTWAWSKVRVLMRADSLGTQFAGDLTVTMNTCVAKYRAYGVYMNDNIGQDQSKGILKGVQCTGVDGKADNSLCQSDAPDSGFAIGSGVSAETAVFCEPEAMICVPSKEPPSFL